jgi:hypothetical protein
MVQHETSDNAQTIGTEMVVWLVYQCTQTSLGLAGR